MMQPKRDRNDLQQESHQILRQLLTMIDGSPGLEIQQFALEAMVRLTGSNVGYIYAIDREAGTARLENRVKPGQESRFIPLARTKKLAAGGIWSPCLAADHPKLCQAAEVTDSELGRLHRVLSVPVRHDGEIVAVIGVANCATPYQEPDSEVLLELASGLGRVIVRKKLHDSMPDDVK